MLANGTAACGGQAEGTLAFVLLCLQVALTLVLLPGHFTPVCVS